MSPRLLGDVVARGSRSVVHAYGRLTAFDDKAWLREFLPVLTATHEARYEKPWQVGDAPPDYVDKMMDAVVGMEIAVTRLMAKWKASQNQPAVNRPTLLAGLEQADQPGAQAMAQLVAEQFGRR